MSIAIALHVLAAVIWVGGMFFAHQCLRPVAASMLEPPVRLRLWSQVFARFFRWVTLAIVILPATGYWMIFGVFGGMGALPLHINLMQGLGILMILIYGHVYFAPYRRMNQAIAAEDWKEAGRRLTQIRHIVGLNLTLGLITAAIAGGGRYFGV